MKKFKSKIFGEIEIDETSDFEFLDLENGNEKANFSISDCNLFGDRLELCIGYIDRYKEISQKAKRAIVENFPENELIKYYFEEYFEGHFEKEILVEMFGTEKFEEINIEDVVEKMELEPRFMFALDKEDNIYLSLDYMVSKEYSDEILVVIMDKELNVTGFSHES